MMMCVFVSLPWQSGQGKVGVMCLFARLSLVGREFLNSLHPRKRSLGSIGSFCQNFQCLGLIVSGFDKGFWLFIRALAATFNVRFPVRDLFQSSKSPLPPSAGAGNLRTTSTSTRRNIVFVPPRLGLEDQ